MLIYSVHLDAWTHLSRGLASNARQSNTSRGRWIGRRTQFRDQPQDVSEQMLGDGDLGHLKRDVTTVAHDLRADLDQLFLQARQRPILDRLRRRQRAQEVAEIVGQAMKLETNGVSGERATAGSIDRALALLDPLFARSALVVEGDHILGGSR